MKILVIGGTRFVGRAMVEACLARGHVVTLFNRGVSNPKIFPQVERVVGDRDDGLLALAGVHWDAVIDTCGYLPRHVRDAVQTLAGSIGFYTFISSISVFARFDQPGLDESSPIGLLEDESTEVVNDRTYGPLKALCERQLERLMPDRSLRVRPGLIIGPHDESDRLTYWAWRVAQGGDVLAPGDPESPMQFIDARDLAAWTVEATERQLTGPYICTGPAERLTTQKLFDACRTASGSDARPVWVGDSFLKDHGLTEDRDVPWWVPEEYLGYATFNTTKARREGLAFRPLESTIQDILIWQRGWPPSRGWSSGLRPDTEARLLEAWRQEAAVSAAIS